MQIIKSEYNSEKHVTFKALSVHQPYADFIVNGWKPFEIRSRNITFRGDFLICSTAEPVVDDRQSGAVLGIVELYDVVMFRDLTDQEKFLSRIEKENWDVYKNHYAWKLRNARKVIEKPIKGGQGLWTLYCNPDFIEEYPEELGQRNLTKEELSRVNVEQFDDRMAIAKRGLWLILAIFLSVFSLIGYLIYLYITSH